MDLAQNSLLISRRCGERYYHPDFKAEAKEGGVGKGQVD
jgi:hypothetical protein